MRVEEQLLETAQQAMIPLDVIDDQSTAITQSLTEVFHANVAKQILAGKYQCIEDGTEIYIHPSSSAFNGGMPYIVFTERVQTKRLYARGVSETDPLLFEGQVFEEGN